MLKEIPLFFWSSRVFENKALENYGDLLSKYIVEKVSTRDVSFYNAPKAKKKWIKKSYLMAIGSIMSYTSKKAVVWGSGIISRKDSFEQARFCAVRGPLSRKRILELGYSCPEVYGDPALLLPRFISDSGVKTHKLGVIPHYVDYNKAVQDYNNDDQIRVIDLLTDDIFKTTDEIRSCERIISSSLHGVIVAHAYGIPAVWVKFSEKLSGDNVKFEDYFMSVTLDAYEGKMLDTKYSEQEINNLFFKHPSLPDKIKVSQIQEGLINAFPEI